MAEVPAAVPVKEPAPKTPERTGWGPAERRRGSSVQETCGGEPVEPLIQNLLQPAPVPAGSGALEEETWSVHTPMSVHRNLEAYVGIGDRKDREKRTPSIFLRKDGPCKGRNTPPPLLD